jgi:EAL domain-containing protein (putative c-di-GMP-specific phosphodiesterase class I)
MDQWEPGAAEESISQVVRDRAIFPVFQPIRDLTTGALVAVEALARGPAGSAVESAPALFAAARAAGQLSRVDQLAFTRAIEVARESPRPLPLLFANAEPAVLNEPPSAELMDAVHAPRPFRIVMEYTERALASEPAGSVAVARLAYVEGNAIAMDDVGADPQSLAFIPLLEPDVIKFDLSLMQHPRSPRAVETVTAVGAYIERTGAVVVAEGIETEEDIVKAHGFGARWGQGWLLGKPGPLDELVDLPRYEGEGLRPPPGPETYLPLRSPFDIAAMQGQIRPADQRAIEDLTDYLLSMATSAYPNTVVLGAYHDEGLREACVPRLEAMRDTAAFVGFTAAPSDTVPRTHNANRPAIDARPVAGSDTTLVVVGPYAASAMCTRWDRGGYHRLIITHDRARVGAIARVLVQDLPSRPAGE